jgi:hypothetical protein
VAPVISFESDDRMTTVELAAPNWWFALSLLIDWFGMPILLVIAFLLAYRRRLSARASYVVMALLVCVGTKAAYYSLLSQAVGYSGPYFKFQPGWPWEYFIGRNDTVFIPIFCLVLLYVFSREWIRIQLNLTANRTVERDARKSGARPSP